MEEEADAERAMRLRSYSVPHHLCTECYQYSIVHIETSKDTSN